MATRTVSVHKCFSSSLISVAFLQALLQLTNRVAYTDLAVLNLDSCLGVLLDLQSFLYNVGS